MKLITEAWSIFSQWFMNAFEWIPVLDSKVGLGFDIATMITILGATGIFLREQARRAISKDRFQIRQEATNTAAGILVSFIERTSRLQSHHIAGHLDVLHRAWRRANMTKDTQYYFTEEVTASILKLENSAYQVLEDTLETRYTLKPVMSALGNDNYYTEFWESSEKLLELVNQLKSGAKLLELVGEFEKTCIALNSDHSNPTNEEQQEILHKYIGGMIGQNTIFLKRSIFNEVSWVYEKLRPGIGPRSDVYVQGVKDLLQGDTETDSTNVFQTEMSNFIVNAIKGNGRVNLDGEYSEPLPRVVFREIEKCLVEFTSQIQYLLSDTSCALGLILSHKEFTEESYEQEKKKYRDELRAGILTR